MNSLTLGEVCSVLRIEAPAFSGNVAPMLSVLDNPEIRKHALPISVAGYHLMAQQGLVAERAELIRGVIIEKMPKSPLHEILTSGIHERLLALLAAGPWWVRKEASLSLTDSEPEPDVSVVSGKRLDYSRGHPTTAHLVIEVAVTSEHLDREKASIYAEAGVGEYWIILANERIVEVHTGAKDGHWANVRRVSVDEALQPTMFPGVQLVLRDFFPA